MFQFCYPSKIGIHVATLSIQSQAPGEANAELGYMAQLGVIDAVLTDDSDVVVYGAKVVIRKYI